ncbi:hypothetical protein BC829DRAFT_120775 [Chytridium lagenaria]|nr:hypothetical protein BC829DRAFT_120775 [Chytridium lagenaria]
MMGLLSVLLFCHGYLQIPGWTSYVMDHDYQLNIWRTVNNPANSLAEIVAIHRLNSDFIQLFFGWIWRGWDLPSACVVQILKKKRIVAPTVKNTLFTFSILDKMEASKQLFEKQSLVGMHVSREYQYNILQAC